MIRRWRDVERWIEQEATEERTSIYPMRALSEVLTERRETLQFSGDLGDWQAITIKFSGAVIPRDRDKVFKGSMFAAYPGDLVFSKIDARNGAVGLIPDSFPKAVVSSEYPVLIPDKVKLRPTYLNYLLRAEHFKADLQRKASGTSGRKRVTPAGFLSLSVPVPELSEQDKLIDAYSLALNHAAKLEQEAQAVEESGFRAIEEALGVAPSIALPDCPVFVARFKDVERWSHEGILRGVAGNVVADSTKWPMTKISEVGKVTYGIQKCPSNRPGIHPRPYLRVANVQRGELDLRVIKYINVPDKEMTKLRLEKGDVLMCEGNSAELVGRGAIWQGEIEDCVHQNHVLRVRFDQAKVVPEFGLAVINSSFGQAYFRSKAKRTTNLSSINSKEVAAMPLPLPPLPAQQSLLDALKSSSQKCLEIREHAEKIRSEAWEAFESSLFEAIA